MTVRSVAAWLGTVLLLCPVLPARGQGAIYVGRSAPAMEQYAARELQRYLYQVSGRLLPVRAAGTRLQPPCFVLGQRATNPLIEQMAASGRLRVTDGDPGPQGYVLKTLGRVGKRVVAIAANDEAGCLYGVYGFLEDHCGVGFFPSGDVLPRRSPSLRWPALDERKTPAAAIRGVLPWTNFPQSATSYSWEDWKCLLDRMARMRLNFLHIHNYNGEAGHNEMFHSFTVGGITSRVWMATARNAHHWGSASWDPARYRFGAADLFDDYDFGADCALHNEGLTNEQVFRKGASLFQKVIGYAHSRGVRMGLGLDINLIPPEYGLPADDPRVVEARVRQVTTDYPGLDYLLCFQSEGIARDEAGYRTWRRIFDGFYRGLRAGSPHTRIAVAGWGLDPKSIAEFPPDVICAPISAYSDGCEDGSLYGQREYWGCPWLERDFSSSEYYYPYNMHLANTVAAWRRRAPNMRGFYCLTWRLTDAVEPKLWYVARAPWDTGDHYRTSRIVYHDYARLQYGAAAADALAPILDGGEPFASDFGECQGTPELALASAGYLLNVARFRLGSGPELPATSFSGQEGVQSAECTEGGQCIGFIEHGDWVRYAGIEFGERTVRFAARVASATIGGVIELRVDRPDGPLIGRLVVPRTGGWQTWVTREASIAATAGRHDLILRFIAPDLAAEGLARAQRQLALVDRLILSAPSPAARARLEVLRCRFAAARDHIRLGARFAAYTWSDLPGAMGSWVANFTRRVVDISTLGNVVSTQNRFVQLRYVALEERLRRTLPVQPPANVEVRGTASGALVTWEGREPAARGYRVYRDGRRLTGRLLTPGTRVWRDRADGTYRYAVAALAADGRESPPSVPVVCQAGSADRTPPLIVVISPPSSAAPGCPVAVRARLLDGRTYASCAATLVYRAPGARSWRCLPMARRSRAVFAATVPAARVPREGIEYYVEATDGSNVTRFPASAPGTPLSLTCEPGSPATAPAPPGRPRVSGTRLAWTAVPGAFWYRLYRSPDPRAPVGAATALTWVEAGTLRFEDRAPDLEGVPLAGRWYYRIAAVSRHDRESAPTRAVAVEYPARPGRGLAPTR